MIASPSWIFLLTSRKIIYDSVVACVSVMEHIIVKNRLHVFLEWYLAALVLCNNKWWLHTEGHHQQKAFFLSIRKSDYADQLWAPLISENCPASWTSLIINNVSTTKAQVTWASTAYHCLLHYSYSFAGLDGRTMQGINHSLSLS